MGCSGSKEPVQISDLDDWRLSSDEKQLIRRSWKRLAPHIEDVGKKVFLFLFDQHPCIKGMFSFRNSCGDELIQHPDFIAHAKRFTKVIQKALLHLEDLERDYYQGLIILGERHQTIPVFYPEYFEIFHHALLYAIEQELKELKCDSNKNLIRAWRKLVTLIIETLKKGYYRSDYDQNVFTL